MSLPSAKGAWPRTVLPYELYSDKNFVPFDEWWEEQRFTVLYKNVEFSRKKLVLEIANCEGDGHVDPMTDERIAILNRSRSPWRFISDDKEINGSGMYEWEWASVCAIGEELIYSLTNDDDECNRRMHNYADFRK